jgi:lipopolysaccharide/colanic/teichoic acid biosynthesis glycosyltransferase
VANNTEDVSYALGHEVGMGASALLARGNPAQIAASSVAADAHVNAVDGALARAARRARAAAARAAARRWPAWYALAEGAHAGPVTGLAVDAGVAVGWFTLAGIPPAAAAFVGGAALAGAYRYRDVVEAQGIGWYARRMPVAVAAAALVAGAAGAAAAVAVLSAVVAAVLVGIVRGAAWLAVAAGRHRGLGLRPALLVGSGGQAKAAARLLEVHPEAGLAAAGQADLDGSSWPAGLVRESGAHNVLVLPDAPPALVPGLLADARRTGASVGVLVPLTRYAGHPVLPRIGDVGVLALGAGQPAPRWYKRAFDVVCAVCGLIVLAPVFAAVALAIRLDDGGPVFYRQRRVGRDHRPFLMWKFRSMVVGADRMEEALRAANIHSGLLFKIDNDPRVTRVGRVLRRLHLDELPQLLNVVKGDMSLVGPRPLPVDPEDFTGPARLRHRVRPGITGPWQVLGGNALDYEEMIELDLAYIATWSFTTDLRLLAGTLPAVLSRRPHP